MCPAFRLRQQGQILPDRVLLRSKVQPDRNSPLYGKPRAPFHFGGARLSGEPNLLRSIRVEQRSSALHVALPIFWGLQPPGLKTSSSNARTIAGLKACSTLALLLFLAGCRQDMHDQPRFKPLAQSDFYADLRSARPPVEGTVARGQLHDDTYFYTGKLGDNPGDYMPFPVTAELLARGQQRYDIYCAPCHSRVGDGNGVIPCAWLPAQAAVLSHRASAQSASGIPLRRDHQRLRSHARLLVTNRAARSLGHRGLHPRVAIEPGSDFRRRSCWTESSVRAAAVPGTRFRRDVACDRNQARARGAEMTTAPLSKFDLMAPPVVKTIQQRSLIIGVVFQVIAALGAWHSAPTSFSVPT